MGRKQLVPIPALENFHAHPFPQKETTLTSNPAAAGLGQAAAQAGTLGDAWRQRVPAAAVCPSATGPVQCCTAAQRYRPLSVALQGCRSPPVRVTVVRGQHTQCQSYFESRL